MRRTKEPVYLGVNPVCAKGSFAHAAEITEVIFLEGWPTRIKSFKCPRCCRYVEILWELAKP